MNEPTLQLGAEMPEPASLARLSVVAGPHAGTFWTFVGNESIQIGRTAPAPIRLPEEAAMSRVHLQLDLSLPTARLMDLSSRNGTWLNGIRIAEASLIHGDRFGVGDTEFVFEVLSSTAASDDDVSPAMPANRSARTRSNSPGSLPSGASIDPRTVQDQQPIPLRTSQYSVSPDGDGSIQETRMRPRRDAGSTTPLANQGDLEGIDSSAVPDAGLADTLPYHSENKSSGGRRSTRNQGPKTPESIGPYQLVGLLGRGGMASVHLAVHRRTKEKFAVKLIRSDVAVSEKQLKLFLREASVLTRLNHARIVRAIEFGLEDDSAYLVMEYIPTIDLMAILEEQQGQSRVKVATWVVSRILQAVHYAHVHGIIHRDIKPGNILAFRTGRHLQVKLADFGLAKCYRDAGLSAMTNEDSVRGTIAYMAPEQLSNSRDSGPSVDLFSCGVCLLRFLTGEITEIHTNRSATYDLIRTHSRIPDSLRPTLERSLQSRPEERFQSATEFAAALLPYHQSR